MEEKKQIQKLNKIRKECYKCHKRLLDDKVNKSKGFIVWSVIVGAEYFTCRLRIFFSISKVFEFEQNLKARKFLLTIFNLPNDVSIVKKSFSSINKNLKQL